VEKNLWGVKFEGNYSAEVDEVDLVVGVDFLALVHEGDYQGAVIDVVMP
jgi:hypothetical protein